MRIIGGHDYYDSGLAWGRDDAVLFLRNGERRMTDRQVQEDLHLDIPLCSARMGREDQGIQPYYHPHRHQLETIEYRRNGNAIRHTVQHAHVILCGVMRNGIHISTTSPYGFSRVLGERWIWTAQALRDFAAENEVELDEGRAGVEKAWRGKIQRIQVDVAVEDLETWFSPHELPDKARSALVDERITIAAMNPLERAPCDSTKQELCWRIDQDGLSAMDFAKAVDPYTAFQEISMWKGGVLPMEGPQTVEITDDKIKIAKHGFHHPTSFRKAKTKA